MGFEPEYSGAEGFRHLWGERVDGYIYSLEQGTLSGRVYFWVTSVDKSEWKNVHLDTLPKNLPRIVLGKLAEFKLGLF